MKSFRDNLIACSATSCATSKARRLRLLRTGTGGSGLFNMIARWTAQAFVAIVGALSLAAMAQPILVIDDASVFEGNSGSSVILKLPVHFVGAQSNTVTGFASAIPLSGVGFNPATGAAVCGASGIDFEQFTNVPFSIPPNTPNGTLSVNITICGDTTIEPDEHIFVSLTGVVGAQCLEGTCNGVGTIVNDDGLPSMSINNVSMSEPAIGSRNAPFTVSLHHPSAQTTSVHFATRDGTAHAACTLPCTAIQDYAITSGTLTIPPNTLSGIINVTVFGDFIRENDETFFVDLSSPVNATILDGTGQATIHDTTLFIGGFDLTPDNATVSLDEVVTYSVDWTVPAGRVWRDLKSIDFRIRGPHSPLWLRWDEASNTYSLCQTSGKGPNDDDAEGPGPGAVCTAGAAPGSAGYLETDSARVYLAESSVTGSGPTGRVVTLEIALSLQGKAAGHTYNVELAAADDFGNQDAFVRASTLDVLKPPKAPKP